MSASTPTGPNGEEIKLQLRTQIQPFHANGPWVEAHFEEAIVPSKTAIIITDMWDKHWCKGATHRVGLIAQKMEPLLQVARGAGILIIHAPSETMDFYSNAPGRLLAQNAPRATPPSELTFADLRSPSTIVMKGAILPETNLTRHGAVKSKPSPSRPGT